jgi:hypothetical protein
MFCVNIWHTIEKYINCVRDRLWNKFTTFPLMCGGALKKIAPSRGRRENFWGISCEKSRFYANKSYFFQLRREARKFWGISCEKSRKSWFFTRNTPKIFAPPSAIGKNMIFWRKIVIFHTKYPKNVRAFLRKWKKIVFFGVKSWFFTRNTSKIFAM